MGPTALLIARPFDATRGAVLRALGPWARPFVRSRSIRVVTFAVLGSATAFLSILAAPLVVLAWTPLLLGVPHLLSDVRYLVVRPGLHRRRALIWSAMGIMLVATALGQPAPGAVLASGVAVVGARASRARRALVLLPLAALAVWNWRAPMVAPLVLVHLHNLFALVVWWRWRPRKPVEWAVPIVFFAGYVALLVGVGEQAAFLHPFVRGHAAGLGWPAQLGRLASGPWPKWLWLRLVLSFGYAQAFHYAVWLRLMPEDDRLQSTPRTFAASWRALEADFGRVPLLLVSAVCLALVVWGVFNTASAGDAYLWLALFHGPLEVAMVANSWTERRPLSGPPLTRLMKGANP